MIITSANAVRWKSLPWVALAVFCLAICSAPNAQAETITISPELQGRFDSYQLYQGGPLGVTQSNINSGNSLVGFVFYSVDYGEEHRNIGVYRLNTLGLTSANVDTATLKIASSQWSANAWSSINIDIVARSAGSTDFALNNWEMYSSPVATIVSAANNAQGNYDITSLFKTALNNANADTGLAIRVWHNGIINTGTIVQYSSPKKIDASSYFTLGATQIDVVTVPEPSTWAMLTVGLTALVIRGRRRRT